MSARVNTPATTQLVKFNTPFTRLFSTNAKPEKTIGRALKHYHSSTSQGAYKLTMKEFRARFWHPALLICHVVLIFVGCSGHHPTEFRPAAEHHEETIDLFSDEEWESVISLSPLPYAPPPDLTDCDTK